MTWLNAIIVSLFHCYSVQCKRQQAIEFREIEDWMVSLKCALIFEVEYKMRIASCHADCKSRMKYVLVPTCRVTTAIAGNLSTSRRLYQFKWRIGEDTCSSAVSNPPFKVQLILIRVKFKVQPLPIKASAPDQDFERKSTWIFPHLINPLLTRWLLLVNKGLFRNEPFNLSCLIKNCQGIGINVICIDIWRS